MVEEPGDDERPDELLEAQLSALAELGETVEVIVDGQRVEAFLSDAVFVLDPSSPDARFALRAYAYCLARRGQVDEARSLLRQFGREG